VGRKFYTELLKTIPLTVILLVGLGYAIGYAISNIIPQQSREIFRTGSFEFDLALGWWCKLDGSEYVCRPPGKRPHKAIAVIAIKQRNDQDNLEAYEAHLREENNSKVQFVRRRTIGDREWVEALHLGSEVRNYHTYYLATNTSSIGILVTMSVHEEAYDEYAKQLNDMIATFTVNEHH